MRLGLLGFPITHSLSPALYKKFLGDELNSYEMLNIQNIQDIPTLKELSNHLDGLNITSPYKTHFMKEVIIDSSLVKQIGAINTIAFTSSGPVATNTDVLAVSEILSNYQKRYGKLHLLLLGNGVMARVTKLVADELNIPLRQFSRKLNPDLVNLDLRPFKIDSAQTIIINACSRDFIFKGKTLGSEIFWDYNYAFLPHQNSLPSLVKSYEDGQELLELQAKAAISFWKALNPKLK
jgi:shikimate dehydrogenase